MTNFWKTYNAQQVLIFKDQDDEGKPVITAMTETSEGVFKISQVFTDDDTGWTKRDQAFTDNEVTASMADKLVATVVSLLGE